MDVDSAFGPRNVRPRATGPTIVDHVNNNTNVEWSSERDSLLLKAQIPQGELVLVRNAFPVHVGFFRKEAMDMSKQ